MKPFSEFLTSLGSLTAHPLSFVLVIAYTLAWIILSGETFEWHALATMVTLLMTLVIQRSEHRDTQAMHAKLDELLRAHKDARTDMSGIDKEEPEEIERLRGRRSES